MMNITRDLMQRTFSIVFAMKLIAVTGAVFLIASCADSFQAKSKCDLVKALNSISLNYTVPCKYDDIVGTSTAIYVFGILLLPFNIIHLTLVLILPSLQFRGVFTKVCLCIVVIFPIVPSIVFIWGYTEISSLKTKDNDVVCMIFCQCRNFFSADTKLQN